MKALLGGRPDGKPAIIVDIELSEKSKKELEDLKKQLNLPDISKDMRV
jgi:hypothetical protein